MNEYASVKNFNVFFTINESLKTVVILRVIYNQLDM